MDWRHWLALGSCLAVVAALLAASAVPGLLYVLGSASREDTEPREGLHDLPASTPQREAMGDLLSAQLDPQALWFVDRLMANVMPGDSPTVPSPGDGQPPQRLADLLDLAGAGAFERLPIPEAHGAEPLLHALTAHLEATGAEIPDAEALRLAIAWLQLDADAEASVARLVLAYTQALRLQAEAMQDLTPAELLSLQGDPDAAAAWFEAHPGEAASGFHAAMADLVRSKVRQGPLLQAGDLLARTVEAERVVLGRSLDPRQAAASPPSADLASAGIPSTASAPWPSGAWQALRGALEAFVPQATGDADVPARPGSGSLDAALRGLASTYGLPESALGGAGGHVGLAPSLESALASLVDAQASGIRSGDPTWHADALLDAAERGEPTLRAWSSLLRLSPPPSEADRVGTLLALLAEGPSPALAVAAAQGSPEPGSPAVPSLPALLEAEGLDAEAAAQAAGSLPPQVQAALAQVLAARAAVERAATDLAAGLTPRQQDAIEGTPAILGLLRREGWTPSEAGQVRAWAEAVHALDPERVADLRQAQAGAVRAVQGAAVLLSLAEGPQPGLPAPETGADAPVDEPLPAGSGAPPSQRSEPADLPVPLAGACPADSGFSDCSRDIFLVLDVAGGIVVTGSGSTRLEATAVNGHAPQVVIDLGGDDESLFAVGSATAAQPFGVHLDAGGDDLYSSTGTAQGAAVGPASVGILWDAAGDDRYLVEASGGDLLAQGAGADGGLGVLVDGSGTDAYSAPGALAQGVGLAPQVQGGLAGASGLLLDLGEGHDDFVARAGQGHTDGTSTVGVLVDQSGASAYTVLVPSRASQGGRGAGGVDGSGATGAVQSVGNPEGGLALLLDLGGRGDSYTSPSFDRSGFDVQEGTLYLRAPHGEARKQDDSLWLDWGRGAAMGIDSTLDDGDGDGASGILELLAGSDPGSSADTPVQAAQRSPALLPTVLAEALQALFTDGDGDRFPDVVETQAGSDPADHASTPFGVLQDGFLVDLPLLCPASSETACNGAATCPAAMGEACISLLSVSDGNATTHTRRAILSVDLGGDDRYLAPVAATTSFWLAPGLPRRLTPGESAPDSPAWRTVSTGGASFDISGNDHYGSATANETQAYASGSAALLLDLQGNDVYEAAEAAQASSHGANGVALLVDFAGDDAYSAGPQSQAFATASPSASAPNSAGAALIDLAGNDHYEFEAQALVTGAPTEGHALLLDAGGADVYNSTAIAVDPLGPSEAFPATLFETQGGVHIEPAPGFRGALSGVFADVGPAIDQYVTLGPAGSFLDVTARKDGVGLVANRVHDPTGARSAATTPVHATAYFVDGGTPTDDADDDGFTNLVEALAGTDPQDPDDLPLAPDPEAPTVAHLAPDGGLLGSPGSLGTLRLPGLVIGGTGPNAYHDYVPFIIDLGGDDSYLAPSVGGASGMAHGAASTNGIQPGSVALLLDVGPGDDTYSPADCIVDTETVDGVVVTHASHALTGDPGNSRLDGTSERPFTTCPSLGGAAAGIAILADNGGRNDFLSRTYVNASVESASDRSTHVQAWGATQGSALFAGVGVLATWNATNRFQAEVHVVASEIDPTPAPMADAIGLAQGAAWGSGVGILAAFGTKDDEYRVVTSAKAEHGDGLDGGSAQDLAQGASRGGQGLLLDEGGNNAFSAPNGFAQGFATPFDRRLPNVPTQPAAYDGRMADQVVGLLWSGPGDDAYLGNSASQGSAGFEVASVQGTATVRSFGILLDGGGNEVYRLGEMPAANLHRQDPCAPLPRGDCAFSQGVGRNHGTGVLLDLAGDDRYEAAHRSYVQGASLGAEAAGLQIDLGGNDVRRASTRAQAYAEGGRAMLADLAGRDAYLLGAFGQALGAGGTAVFLDGGGHDRYDYGGPKVPTARPPSAFSDSGNNWTWTNSAETSEFGADAETLEQALDAYRNASVALGQQPREGGQVALDLSADAGRTEPITDGGPGSGIVYLRATATPEPGFQVQRADFLLDGILLGVAAPAGPGEGPGSQAFDLAWDTRTVAADPSRVAFTDGPHDVTATAFFTSLQPAGSAAAPAGRSFVGAPDGISRQSRTANIVLDNPPVATGELTTDALGGLGRNAISPALGQLAKLNVRVSADAAFPPEEEAVEGKLPGARFEVVLRDVTKPASSAVLAALQQYVHNGTTDLFLDGRCLVSQRIRPCPDGSYAVNTTVMDGAGQATWLPEFPLLIDGTAPTSTVEMPVLPAWAGLATKVGFSGIGVRWRSDDDPLALGAGNVAGIAGPLGHVAVFRLDAAGAVVDNQQFGGGATAFPFQDPPVGTGDIVHILTVATDGLGNAESRCRRFPAEEAPCFLTKAGEEGAIAGIGIDFSPPELTDLRISRGAVKPATDLAISAVAADEAAGLVVQLRLAGVSVAGVKDPTFPLAKGPDGRYGKTIRFDAPPSPQETPFSYTVTAADRAGNHADQSGTAFLDSQLPMLDGLTVSYTYDGSAAPHGRPGSRAFVAVNVTDHELASLTAGAPFGEEAPVPCNLETGKRWQCEVVIPETADHGDHPLVLTATDAAGNVRTLTAALVVAGQPPHILDAAALATGPGSVRVTWNTSTPATSHVRFGLVPLRLDDEMAGPCADGGADSAEECWEDASTEHAVEVTGLVAGTTYYFQPASRGLSNVANETAPILEVKTQSGYGLDLPGFDGAVAWAARHNVTVAVTSLVGQGPVKVVLGLRDSHDRTQEVGSFTGLGQHTVPVDTRTFPDGTYTLVLHGKRQADLQDVVSPPFRLDNTPPVLVAGGPRPGLTTREARPGVDLVVVDPFNADAPALSSLVALIDGSAFTPVEPAYTASGSQHRLAFRLPATLASGDHNLTVRLTDAAGNVGEAQWAFAVDAATPLLQGVPRLVYLPGPVQAAPGGKFTLELNATDPSTVANVTIDMAAAGGGKVGLFAHNATAWSGIVDVPAGAPSGRLVLPILAGDAFGNAGPIGKVEIVVDRDAPRILASSAKPLNMTAASVAIRSDEPTAVKLRLADRPVQASGNLTTEHDLAVLGLRPGMANPLTLEATDGAGHVTSWTLVVTPPADTELPSQPGSLVAASTLEGVVHLSWAPARDNAGIDHYQVVRTEADRSVTLPKANGTTLRDDTAPAGQDVTYEVSAVDVAGQRSPSAQAAVRVLALPRLTGPSIAPARGPSDTPFHVDVTYTHATGLRPDSIELQYDGLTFQLLSVGEGDCKQGCHYAAEVRLPALSTLRATPTATVVAQTGDLAAEAEMPAPLVSAGAGDGVEAGSRPASLPGLLAAGLGVVAAAVARRLRRDPQ